MKSLSNSLKPKKIDEVIGQTHLVGSDGLLTKMLAKKLKWSFILYGPPGSGKTTIATLFAAEMKLDHYLFNAAIDNKNKLKDILDTIMYNDILIVVDEIHRMKKDIQDYLLPYLEDDRVMLIGLTTTNPYHSINHAIRSRLRLFPINPISNDEMKIAFDRAEAFLRPPNTISGQGVDKLIDLAGYDLRTFYNLVETAFKLNEDLDLITLQDINKINFRSNLSLDNDEENYYHILSALQKSIRGSDVDAAIHYLARLVTLGDLESIIRRLLVISYEDVGLANPSLHPKVVAATQAAVVVGFPEARIILSSIVVEMALSPKSNSSQVALDNAIIDYQKGITGNIPLFLNNSEIMRDSSLYKLPHELPNSIDSLKYLPDEIIGRKYYIPKETSPYEKALGERKKIIDELKKY